MGMEISAVAYDGEGRIAADLACLRCGYNLRLLRREAVCPECGVGVERTLRGDLLRYSDANWLQGVADGLGILVYTIAATLAITIISAALFPISKDRPAVATAIELVARGCCAVGAWRFGRPQRDALRLESLLGARRMVRLFGILQIVPLAYDWPGAVSSQHELVETTIVGLNICYLFSILSYAKGFCVRVGARRSETVARKLLLGCAFSMGWMIFGLAEQGHLFPWRSRSGMAITAGLTTFMCVSFATILFLAGVRQMLDTLAEALRLPRSP